MRWIYWIFLLIIISVSCRHLEKERISFNRDIRPILNEKCMRCHGGVKAMGGFNLLFAATALGPTEAGRPAIIPGKHQQSELYRRITATDPELRMPLDAQPLSEREINLIARWIDEGAAWEKHWAYIPPAPDIQVPAVEDREWVRNEIDHFILRALKEQGLSPNPTAPQEDLLRRLYFDLTGLPPSPEEAEAFLHDPSPKAYDNLVDRLLDSPHYGERWATMWLDLARYADTKGYEKDSNRSIWKYRDWVIDAFNQDLPFDQFTIEQLAGDLLENPTEAQLIATAFHRNSISNDEGGTDDETFRIASVIERVGTTYEVWQSTTMACVQCHSHPYDPFLQEEFYTSMAFFNNSQDRDIYNEQPKLFTYPPEQAGEIAALIDWIEQHLPAVEKPTLTGTLYEKRTQLLDALDYRVVEAEEYTKSSPLIELIWPDQDMLWQVQDTSWIYFREVDLSEVQRIGFLAATPLNFAGTIAVHLDGPNGPKIGETRVTRTGDWPGWQGSRPPQESLFKEFVVTISPTEGKRDLYFKFGIGDTYIQHLFYLDKIIYYEKAPVKDQYGPDFQHKLKQLAHAPVQMTPIIRELPPDRARVTRVYDRGSWLTPGDTVKPNIPHIFASDSGREITDRLAFAQWMVSPENPLTARVIVNRIWEQIFGLGLVDSMEEFGSQGAKPTHPELLDWLAVRLQKEHQWSLKALIREILLSAAYRQDSAVDPEKLEIDPNNKWLSRGVRTRLSAEQIRDQILALSGLLDRTIGGPSVVLPELGISESFIPHWAIRNEEGPYRRSLYTFWKRTDPFPDMITFDSPDRAMCNSQRIRTNTPLQALNLLNDEIYFAAAGSLARQMYATHETPEKQIAFAYRQLLFHPIHPKKLELLAGLYDQSLAEFKMHPEKCRDLVPQGEFKPEQRPEIAALTLVANALFNLDELIVKS